MASKAPKTPVYTNGSTPYYPGGPQPATPAPATPTGPSITNTAQANPAVQSWLDNVSKQFGSAPTGGKDPYLEESIGNLRARLSADNTARTTQRATGKIMDQAAGIRALNAGSAGRRGFAARSGVLGKLDRRTNDAAQRAAAGAAADIQIARERDLDNLTLAGHGILASPSQLAMQQEAAKNGLLGVGLSGASTLASIGLQDRQLGLSEWQAMSQEQRARVAMEQAEQARREGQLMALYQMDPEMFGGQPPIPLTAPSRPGATRGGRIVRQSALVRAA